MLQARDLTPLQAGRLVQRVLELETYRLMALLALPVARRITPEVTAMEGELARINQELAHPESDADQRALLDELSDLAARVERYRSDTTYRFAATNAYYDLVNERIGELGEEKIPGLQPVKVFIDRRLGPGIRTCNAVRDRLEGLSSRIAHASDLLRTRVELAIQGQNRELLSSMNRRSEVQLAAASRRGTLRGRDDLLLDGPARLPVRGPGLDRPSSEQEGRLRHRGSAGHARRLARPPQRETPGPAGVVEDLREVAFVPLLVFLAADAEALSRGGLRGVCC